MEKIVEQGRLYDFYGELLTPHQRKVYEAAVYEDLSLSEIAEQEGISRQGVHDLIRRVTNTLQGYEDKLHMIARFDRLSAHVRRLRDAAAAEDFSEMVRPEGALSADHDPSAALRDIRKTILDITEAMETDLL